MLDSFNPATYPGERNHLAELGVDAAVLGTQLGLSALIGRVVGGGCFGYGEDGAGCRAVRASGLI